ncbi:SAM-dependent methyltransferase [Thermoplasma sp. Kam2015]|uniref:class I SAM-dependent methyltransferase n=1 Tax=Thermoplasma sp. Kam2015 TaxID=2094122 RepID=UPI000D87F75D|nr:class I SAM-dependent methyltransferase [Thermoplasma sp. Kam2015]PYB68835.1 SAM-dependent methyltransferase [Thermoplasma sp. Kam2015]
MDDSEDAFGHALMDYSKGRCSYEMVETRSGKIDVTSISYYFRSFDQWPGMEKDAIKHATGKIIDVGAGAGRHSLYLQNLGFDVIAMDISPLAVKVMKNRGVRNVVLGGIEDIHGPWDTLILLGNNFGLLRTVLEAKGFLRKFYQQSSDDARIIAETTDPYASGFTSAEGYSGELEIRVIYDRYRTDWFRYLLVDKAKLMDIIEDTGWHVDKLYEMSGVDVYCFVLSK